MHVRHRSRWGAIPESLIEDTRLGLDARGAAAWLAIRPDGWQIVVPVMLRRLGIGRDRWRRIAIELEAAGYLIRTRRHDDDGHWQWTMTFDPLPEPAACGSAVDGGASHGAASDGDTIDGSAGDIGGTNIGGGGRYISTTTTPTPDDYADAAVMVATSPPRNELKYRQAIIRRITRDGPTDADQADLVEANRRREAARKRAEQVEAERLRDQHSRTPEARATAREHTAALRAMLPRPNTMR